MLNSNSVGLLFQIRGDSSSGQRASRDFKNQVDKDTDQIESDFKRIGSSAQNIGGIFQSFIGNLAADAVANLTRYLVDGAKAVVDYSSRLEQTKIGFSALLGNAEKANKLLKELQTFSKTTPFEFAGITSLAQRLLGANVEAEKIIPLLKDIGNIVAATGDTSIERFEGINTAITQIISKGRVSAEEMEQLAERGIPAWKLLAEAIGKTVGETRKLAEDGAISADVLLQALQKISREKFGDAMAKQADTFRGATTIIKDSLLQTAATAFEPLYKEISKFAVRFSKEIQQQKGDFYEIGELIAKYIGEGLGAGLGAIFQAIGAYLGKRLNQIFTEGKIVDPITHKLTKGLIDSFLISLGVMSETPQQTSVADLRRADDTNRIGAQTQDFIKIGENAEKQRKEREETAKRDTAALIKIWQDYLSEVNTSFDDVFKKIEERFKETGNAEEFRQNLEQIVNIYKEKAYEANGALYKLESLQADQLKKTQGERLALNAEWDDRWRDIEERHLKARQETEKQITEISKKQGEERVKQSEQEANRKIAIEKSSLASRFAQLDFDLKNGLIKERDYIETVNKLKLKALEDEKQKTKEIIITKENKIDIEDRLKVLDDQIAIQTLENLQAILDYEKRRNDSLLERIEKTFLLLELERKLKEEYTAPAGGAEPPSDTPGIGDVDIQPGGFWGIIDRMEEMLENETPLKLADQFRAMGEIVSNAFLDISNAIGNVLTDWILYGETGPAVMRKILASALASIAAEAAVRAIYATALGFLRLAQWDFAGAASAFTSAAIWASIAGVTAITGRAIAGDAFRRETSGAFGGSSAGSSGSSQSRDAQIIESGRNAPAGSFLQISIKDKPDWFEDMFVVSLRQNGRIRQEILNLQNV